MLCFVIFVCLASWVQAQNGRGPQHLDHNGHGWDIRLAVPGNPGNDYPTLGTIPRTTFSCAGREPGYYADIETNCQVFRVCTVGSTYGFQSFLCPNGTLFNQAVFVCDWWMNVNCQNSEKLFTFNNDQFENLRLGPQLMKDIKKMLTHPMRNPYDKAAMKANVIVMQDYKPPAGQLFPNEALIAGPERAPNNVYVPKQNLIQNVYNSENAYYGSTVEPKYVPTAFTTIRPTTYRDSEFFQRQIQYDQSNRLQSTQRTPAAIISNGHTGQFAQYQNSAYTNSNTQLQRPIQNNNVRNAQYNQRQSSITGNSQTSNLQNFQQEQFNRQLQNDNRKASYTNSIRQQTSLSFPKPQFNNTQNKFNQQIKSTPSQKNTLELAEEARKEVKQDVALVFSLLADSINAAKEYSNYAQREVLQSTSATPLTQYRSNQDVTQISNQISQLTASQFANNNRIPNIITPSSPLIQENQIRSNSVYADNQLNQVPQIPTQFSNAQQSQLQRNYYSTQFQPNTNTLNANLLDNNNQIYSGQLYQFPVPDVTNQIYNRPFTGNLVQSNNIPTTNLQPSNTLQLTNINRNVELRNQAPTAVQIVPSQTLPFNSVKLQAEQTKQTEPFNQESITNLLNTGNGISAQLRDRIIGTIPHPAEDNKLVTYEKDQSYYFTSNLNGKPSTDIRNNAITSNTIETQSSNNANGKFPDLLTFQFIPSVSYELEDKKEQQQILDAFQIDEFGAPRDVVNSNLIQNADQGRNLQTNNVGYSANQVVSAKQIDDNNNNISPLYDGPSSYLAPQSSVGNLRSQPETVQNNLNSRLEDFDEDSSNGYPKTRPTREFTF
ncbi:myb-like protein P isoform X1 [Manduca sexta]|uniref:myb-like protein P isoform X1 n=2 Tax=Manduca sexta TaxID=7130 RepID=UPI00188FFA80|nr:myb-like protein P isoform X1 [Manduca sexta]